MDAIGYLAPAHLFTAHMSGNTVALGASVGQGEGGEALRRAVAISLFAAGIALGTAIGELHVRTTYISGVLTSLMEAIVHWVFRRRGAPGARVRVYASVWGAYLLGAAPGGIGYARAGLLALILRLPVWVWRRRSISDTPTSWRRSSNQPGDNPPIRAQMHIFWRVSTIERKRTRN